MAEVQSEEIITRKFLESALNRKIENFIITSGTKAGDNYSSTMYSIEVHLPKDSSDNNKEAVDTFIANSKYTEKSRMHLISKCFPKDQSRQEMLVKLNCCHKELSFYTVFVPELIKMQQLNENIRPAFPPVVAGSAVNFDAEKPEPGTKYKPFDNYIMMIDLRKHGYSLYPRLKSFDRAHVSQIFNAMAKNHALSWIYKQKHNIQDITTKFPFISNDFSNQGIQELYTGLLVSNGTLCYNFVEKALGESSPVAKGTKKFVDSAKEMLSISYGSDGNHLKYRNVLRVIPDKGEDNINRDIPWKVVVQGDCWTNNMLFRYNEISGEPEDVILVDLQMIRERCPTTDLVNMIYTSTDAEFRRDHLEDMLELYALKFLHYCQVMKSEPLPGFSVQELKRRFHLSKPFGFCLGLLAVPIMLIQTEIKQGDVEIVKEGHSAVDMLTSLCGHSDKDDVLKNRVLGLCQDMYNDGII